MNVWDSYFEVDKCKHVWLITNATHWMNKYARNTDSFSCFKMFRV